MITIKEIGEFFTAKWKGKNVGGHTDSVLIDWDEVQCEVEESFLEELEDWIEKGKPDLSTYFK